MSAKIAITPSLSKAARRELLLTQNNVIADSGIQAYKLKQFEAERYNLDLNEMNTLREFYESRGVDIEKLAAHEAAKRPADAGPTLEQRGITQNARPGFFVADSITPDQLDRALERMDENEQRITVLLEQEHSTAIFGGVSDETDKATREIFGLMAENHMIFRFLQGKSVIKAAKYDPKTIGDHIDHWATESPIFDVLSLSDESATLETEEV